MKPSNRCWLAPVNELPLYPYFRAGDTSHVRSLIAVTVGCRLVLQLKVDHTLRLRPHRWWLGPARDLLAFGVYVASFFVNVVSWRGRRYRVRSDGTLTAIGEPKA